MKFVFVVGPISTSGQRHTCIGPCIHEVTTAKCNGHCTARGYLGGACEKSSAMPPFTVLCCCVKQWFILYLKVVDEVG